MSLAPKPSNGQGSRTRHLWKVGDSRRGCPASPRRSLTSRRPQNAQNLAKFQRLVDEIHENFREREGAAMADDLPDWLFGLIGTWRARQATVITFNYDLLVEYAMERWKIQDFDGPLGPDQAIGSTSSAISRPTHHHPARWAGPLIPTFQLLRLHGALNWYWVPGDTSGATLHRWELDHNDEERARYLPGRRLHRAACSS